jgi:hypothetical protein
MTSDTHNFGEQSPEFDRFTKRISYSFSPKLYNFETSSELTEDDAILAIELRHYYPELKDWPNIPLATAWRSYSQKVGLVTEEYVCVREPNFLAFLYVIQEGWQVDENQWIDNLNQAVAFLWK